MVPDVFFVCFFVHRNQLKKRTTKFIQNGSTIKKLNQIKRLFVVSVVKNRFAGQLDGDYLEVETHNCVEFN